MKDKILKLLRENARIEFSEIALRCGISVDEVKSAVTELENSGIIRGYTVVADDSASGKAAPVKALIEVKVTPRRDGGFDQVAQRIAKFPEVTDLILLSGSYDLLLTIQGESLQEVANFVAEKLATIDGVISTSTGFMLRKYKESGHIMQGKEDYERLKLCF